MSLYTKECGEVFLRDQLKLFEKPVAETVEEALEFLEDNFAVILDSVQGVREYLEDSGMDAGTMSDEEIKEALEVFPLKNGKYLVVEA